MALSHEVDVVSAPLGGNYTLFLSGPPGSGKTARAIRRLLHLLEQGVPGEQVLVLVPQRTLARPYRDALAHSPLPPGSQVDVVTIGGLARRTIDLFWPLVADAAGFADARRHPVFLTLETAQHVLHGILEPLLLGGAFDGVTIPRGRLVSQILDNLNKAAAVGFPPSQIAERLKAAWAGDSSRLRVFDRVQEVALAFRDLCLAHSLLDWSLQLEVFWRHLLPLAQLRRYLLGGYRHLIVDNVEEDIPVAHDLLALWLPLCESALVLEDIDGGYRVFLGARPQGARDLAARCRDRVAATPDGTSRSALSAIGEGIAAAIDPSRPTSLLPGDRALVLPEAPLRFYPEMLDWVAQEVARLVLDERVPAGEIAVLAPFVSDSLRFMVTERLRQFGVSARTHRPSRELREEPVARCLLTLAKLAHPLWKRSPLPQDVAHSLAGAIAELDPVRARLLADIVYRIKEGGPSLAPFHQLTTEAKDRIGYVLGNRYERLRCFLQEHAQASAENPTDVRLDHFWSLLFAEVLTQPGFAFRRGLDAGATARNLIESALKFRQALDRASVDNRGGTGPAYVEMVELGAVAAQYVNTWPTPAGSTVLLAPAYTFLMTNDSVGYQFWLDIGNPAWFQRIHQPLTHPYVLSRDWPPDQRWTDVDEQRVRQAALARLVLGLCRRCRERIYLGYCMLSEHGFEQQGPLLQAVDRVLRRAKGGRA